MSKFKPDATPWAIEEWGGEQAIVSCGDKFVVGFVLSSPMKGYLRAQKLANGNLICRAVNAHEALLEAARGAKLHLGMAGDISCPEYRALSAAIALAEAK